MSFVSILLPAYNPPRIVERTIASVTAQSFRDFELVIIDDASSDESALRLVDLASTDPRLRLFRNRERLGVTGALNVAWRKSQYSLLARIDSDDWWHEDKLARQVAFLDSHSAYSVVGTSVKVVDFISGHRKQLHYPTTPSEVVQRLYRGTPFAHSSILFRRDCAEYDGYDERYDTSQDYELYLRLLRNGLGINLNEVLTFRTTHHPNSISSRMWRRHSFNGIRIRRQVFATHSPPPIEYKAFLRDALVLCAPPGTKRLIAAIRRMLGRHRKDGVP